MRSIPDASIHPIVVVGAGARGRSVMTALRAAGVTAFAALDKEPGGQVTLECEVVRSVFDDESDTWALHTAGGEVVLARVVIATHRPPWRPWLPDLPGRKDFRGESFHAAAWERHFYAAGKHVAVVGADSGTGHYLSRLIESAQSVTVFAHAPRRVVTRIEGRRTRATRWLRRPSRIPAQVGSQIAAVTATGVRTTDGVEHPVDAIIYGTGFTMPESDEALVGAAGTTLRQAWHDGMEPFAGVAVHGFPNYFFAGGPDIDAQARYIAQCIALMNHSGSGRIEVRRSSQQVFNERAQLGSTPPPPVASAFEVSSSAPDYDDTYDGEATLEIGGIRHQVRVRLIGHLDPLDGNYHWQGTVFEALPEESLRKARSATLSVGHHTVPARIVEKTPWGTHSVAGVGAPPYAHIGR